MTSDEMQARAIDELVRLGHTREQAKRMMAFTTEPIYELGKEEPVGFVQVPSSNGGMMPIKSWPMSPCAYCGSILDESQMKCPRCGAPRWQY